MSIIYIVTLFAIGFFIVWEIKAKKSRKKQIEVVEEPQIETIESSIEKPIAKKKSKKIEDNSTPQKRGRKKKIQN